MPDLDTEFRGLRDDLHTTIHRPELADIASRARQQSVRRRVVTAAVAAVLVIAAAVPLLRDGGGPDTRPAAPQETPPLRGVTFVTPERGYAIGDRCSDDPGDCRYDLLTTMDGGESWTARWVPAAGPAGTYTFLDDWYAVGPQEVILDLITTEDGWERIHSVDSGVTWSVVPAPVAAETVTAIPDGGRLAEGCVPMRTRGAVHCPTVGATLPGSGQIAPLAVQPPVRHPVPGEFPTAGGAWWVSGRDLAGTDRAALAVSRDAGRTWTTSVVDVPWVRGEWSVAEHAGRLYAAFTSHEPTDVAMGPALLAIVVSADGGATWTKTWSYAEGTALGMTLGDLVVRPSGELLVTVDGGTYVSTDEGRTFAEADQQIPGVVDWIGVGYLQQPREWVRTGHGFSVEGVAFKPFTVG